MLIIFKNILKFRELIVNLVIRELKSRYRGTALGFLWTLLNPLLLMMVYTLVFSLYMRIEMENYASYVFCGLLPWIWFTSSMSEGANSIIAGASLLTKSNFPVEVIPVVSVLCNLINYLLSLPVLLVFLAFNKILPEFSLIYIFPLLFLQLLFTFGLVLMTASLNVFFRDVHHIIPNLLTLWFFLCPIIYPSSIIPSKFKIFLYFNPMALFSLSYQNIFYFNKSPALSMVLTLVIISTLSVFIGSSVFNRFKYAFAEEL